MMFDQVIDFWFKFSFKDWFSQNDSLDQAIAEQFSKLHGKAAVCELYAWRSSALGRLAEIIVLDQFSRNLYRNHFKAFSQDSLALALAQEAINMGMDQELTEIQRAFLYMPFMHSESKAIHQQAIILFRNFNNQRFYEFELKHQAIINRFGRYPHRNRALARESTEEELLFIAEPGSGF